jgi:hypothetical protein
MDATVEELRQRTAYGFVLIRVGKLAMLASDFWNPGIASSTQRSVPICSSRFSGAEQWVSSIAQRTARAVAWSR